MALGHFTLYTRVPLLMGATICSTRGWHSGLLRPFPELRSEALKSIPRCGKKFVMDFVINWWKLKRCKGQAKTEPANKLRTCPESGSLLP